MNGVMKVNMYHICAYKKKKKMMKKRKKKKKMNNLGHTSEREVDNHSHLAIHEITPH